MRHAESEGNVDNFAYTYVPDPQVPLVSADHLCLVMEAKGRSCQVLGHVQGCYEHVKRLRACRGHTERVQTCCRGFASPVPHVHMHCAVARRGMGR